MGAVCSYLKKIDWAEGFPLDLVDVKLQQLNKELAHIMYVVSQMLHSLYLIAFDQRCQCRQAENYPLDQSGTKAPRL